MAQVKFKNIKRPENAKKSADLGFYASNPPRDNFSLANSFRIRFDGTAMK